MSLSTLSKSNVVVAGGTGFIGRAVCARLIALGCQVYAICRSVPAQSNAVEGVTYLPLADLRANDYRLIAELKPDYSINAFGKVDHSSFYSTGLSVIDQHHTFLAEFVEATYSANLKKFVQIGSSDEYGMARGPQSETLNCHPRTIYGLQKNNATRLCLLLAEKTYHPNIVVRPFLVYGPGMSADRFLSKVIINALARTRMNLTSGNQIRDFLHIKDFVEALCLILIAKTTPGTVLNVASGQGIAIRKVCGMVKNLVGYGDFDFGSYASPKEENECLVANVNEIKRLLGWVPKINLKTGIEHTIPWFKNTQLFP